MNKHTKKTFSFFKVIDKEIKKIKFTVKEQTCFMNIIKIILGIIFNNPL